MKRFFNEKETIVTEALDGVVALGGAGALVRLDGYPYVKVVRRANVDGSKVAVVSGGGAGHEPAHAGFVGSGLLTAAVSGEIFASPSVDAVLAAILSVTGEAGCLLVVKNYTGDRLNFGLAAEKARAMGRKVEMVIVADDIALPDSPQPRGVAGTLFVHKIAGHLAEGGRPLTEVKAAAESAARDIVSLGVSLSTCRLPGQPPKERLSDEEAELGLGIHGEPGAEKIAMQEVRSIVELMAERLQTALGEGTAGCAALVNNLGSVPPIEMTVIAHELLRSSLAPRIEIVFGPAPLMTSLDMNGFSLSLLPLDDARREALTSPVAPVSWVPGARIGPLAVLPMPATPDVQAPTPSNDPAARAMLARVCERLVAAEAELNALDAKIGDGDTGFTVATAARAVLSAADRLPLAQPGPLCRAIGDVLATSMGGSSGVIGSIFFTATGESLEAGADWPTALSAGLERIRFYGGAGPGDRTLVDALAPAIDILPSGGLVAAVDAAERGAEATARMTRARAGRSAHVGASALEGVVDPGALAIARAFRAALGDRPAAREPAYGT